MTNNPESVTVEQVDREATASFLARLQETGDIAIVTKLTLSGIREGGWDQEWEVQAFAAHRQQAVAAMEEQITGLIHDVERWIKAGSEEATRAAALEAENARLRELAARSTLLVADILDIDHERGCWARQAACECGYSDRLEDSALQLRAALQPQGGENG